MTSRPLPALRGRAVALVLSLLLVLPLLLIAAPANAARPESEIQRAQIEIKSMDPAMPARDGTITLTGTVTNTTDAPISNLQVLLWRDQSPITDPEGLSAAIESNATTPYGARLLEEGAYHTVTDEQRPSIPPGESAEFRVTADVSALELPSTGGAYLVGAHALGQVGGAATETLGRSRLLLPMPAEGSTGTEPAPTTDVVVLSTEPTRAGDGVFLNDNLTPQLAEGGRLNLLLEAAARPGASWVIDPALLDSLRAMADGYNVVDGEANGQQLAQSWLDEYARLNDANGFRATYGLPDASDIAASDNPELWERVKRADAAVEGLESLPRLEVSGGGRVDAQGLALLEQNDPMAVLASTPDSDHSLLQPVDEAPVINFDADLFTGGPGPTPHDTLLHKRQRLLAESWVRANIGEPETQVRLVTTGIDATAAMQADAPWVQPMTLRDLLAGERFEWAESLDYTATDVDRQAIGRHGEPIDQMQSEFSALQSLFGDEAVQDSADAGLAAAASSWWRGRPQALTDYTSASLRRLDSMLSEDSVSLAVSSSVTMLAQDGGSFPATIQNHLDRPIRVSLEFESAQPQRLSIPSHENIEIPPGGTTTLTVRPEAAANGPVDVTAQLTTPNGAPLGQQTPIQVNATNFGAVGWIIVVASGIVLVATTALRIRQVRNERSDEDDEGAREALPATIGPSSAASLSSADQGGTTGDDAAAAGVGRYGIDPAAEQDVATREIQVRPEDVEVNDGRGE